MAGLPEPVIVRAREILHHLESQDLEVTHADEAPGGEAPGGEAAPDDAPASGDSAASGDGLAPRAPAARADTVPDLADSPASQMDLFQAAPDPVAEQLKERLRVLDPDRMTPIEALMALAELKSALGA